MLAIVVQVVPGQKVTWQLRKGFRLPAWLTLELADRGGGVDLRHTIGRVPWRRADPRPAARRYLSAEFAAAMDEHARTEFSLLRNHLAEPRHPS